MTRTRSRTDRVRAVLVVCLLAIAAVVAPLAGPPAAQAAPGEVTVHLTEVTPAVLRPGLDLVVTGTITNETDEVLTDPYVRLRMQSRVPASRNALAQWLDGSTTGAPTTLTLAQLGRDVPPGATVPFTISIPAEDSPFVGSPAWGPRGFEVLVSQDDVSGQARSVLLWYPAESQGEGPTELTVLLPLTPTAQEWTTATEAGVLVGQVAAERISALIEATADLPVVWGLDPVLLELPDGVSAAGGEPTGPGTGGETDDTDDTTDDGTEPGGDAATEATTGTDDTEATADTDATTDPTQPTTDGATDPGTDAPPSGTDEPTGDPGDTDAGDADPILTVAELTAFVRSLVAASAQRDVVALSYADADAVTMTAPAAETLREATADRTADLLSDRGVTVLDDVEWPASVDPDALAAIARSTSGTVVLPADQAPTTDDLTYTPSGRTEITTTGGDLQAVLWDGPLSEALTTPDLTTAEAQQSVLAQTAVITRERPNDPRGLMAALPRDIGTDAGEITRLRTILESLDQAPWLEVTSLRNLLGRSAGTEGRALQVTADDGDRLSADDLTSLGEAWTGLTAFNEVLADPGALTNAPAVALLSAPAAALLEAPRTRDELTRGAMDAVGDLRSMISVQAGSSVLLISDAGEIPITIENDLDADASVVVQLEPSDPRLRADEVVPVTIPALGSTTVRIPVTAVANGDVTVEVLVLAEDGGTPVAEASSFDVRVRADWESTGLTAAVVVLAIAFVFGLFRTIRRGGRRFPPEAAAALEEEAAPEEKSAPEEAATAVDAGATPVAADAPTPAPSTAVPPTDPAATEPPATEPPATEPAPTDATPPTATEDSR